MGSRRRRQAWIVVAVCAGALVAALTWSASIATGSSSAGDCARRAQESSQRLRHPTGTGRRVLVIGDSYSLGAGLGAPSEAWPSQLPGRVFVHGFGGTGFSRTAGRCRSEAFDQRAPQALAVRPDLVLVEGGLNDFDQPLARIEAGYRHLLAELAGRRVVLVGPARAPARATGAERVDAILRRETARTGTPYVSMLRYAFSYLPDGVHLTAGSQELFGAIVADHLPPA